MLDPRPCTVRGRKGGDGIHQDFKSSRAMKVVVDGVCKHGLAPESAAHRTISKPSRRRPRVTHTRNQG
eukprot:1235353-Pyramimonas_sp.AAC.1